MSSQRNIPSTAVWRQAGILPAHLCASYRWMDFNRHLTEPDKTGAATQSHSLQSIMTGQRTKWMWKKKHQKAIGGGEEGGKRVGNIPSLKKYCQKENDRKNETETDNTRRRKEGQKKSERKGRWHFQQHGEKDGERRALAAELTECNISCGERWELDGQRQEEPKNSFKSGAAGETDNQSEPGG